MKHVPVGDVVCHPDPTPTKLDLQNYLGAFSPDALGRISNKLTGTSKCAPHQFTRVTKFLMDFKL